MTTGPVKGNSLLLYVGSTAIACTTDAAFSFNRKTIDATCKDNDGAEQILPGGTGGSFTMSGIWRFDASYGVDDLADIFLNSTKVTIKYSTEVTGDFYLQADAYITDFSGKAGLNAVADYSATFTITGTITKAVVA